jgi:hypothetical protein
VSVHAGGTEVTSRGTLRKNGAVISWTAGTDDAMAALAGKTVTMRLTVKPAANATHADNKALINKGSVRVAYKKGTIDPPADPAEVTNRDGKISFSPPAGKAQHHKKGVPAFELVEHPDDDTKEPDKPLKVTGGSDTSQSGDGWTFFGILGTLAGIMAALILVICIAIYIKRRYDERMRENEWREDWEDEA